MNITEIKYCPGTLAKGFNTYSKSCLIKVFNGKKVSHILPYNPPGLSEEDAEKFLENRKRISISGVQEKLSFILDKNKLRLTHEGEQGTYILKPIPRDLKKVDQIPANEHLTMQIAKQVYGINTAENALIFFKDGTPAYITKRFDIRSTENKTIKWAKEDFATLAGKTIENSGYDFKYQGSYEDLGNLIKEYVPAWRVEIEKFFTLIIFNYLFSNGDAHLKNFSILESESGDHFLSPAYDLINTRIHVNDTDFALDGGLFSDSFKSRYMKINGHAGLDDFIEFSKRLQINQNRISKIIDPFLQYQDKVETLIKYSYLNEDIKRGYLMNYQTRRNHLNKQ